MKPNLIDDSGTFLLEHDALQGFSPNMVSTAITVVQQQCNTMTCVGMLTALTEKEISSWLRSTYFTRSPWYCSVHLCVDKGGRGGDD